MVAVVVLAACGLVMRAAGIDVRPGPPPEFGMTVYPLLAIVGPAKSGKFLPRQIRPITIGTLVTWADGSRTLYLHR